jgi:hypothetical protein
MASGGPTNLNLMLEVDGSFHYSFQYIPTLVCICYRTALIYAFLPLNDAHTQVQCKIKKGQRR